MKTIFTIGYQRLAPARLREIAEGLDALVIDCRSSPKSRMRGYGANQIRALLGERYRWMGDQLGGRGEIDPAGIERLRTLSRDRNLMLMCLEEAPGDCHRHFTICEPHFPDAVHIFEDELVLARDLTHCIENELDDYRVFGSLSDVLSINPRRSSPD